MCRLISAIFVISVLAILRSANGYKWVALKSGDPIPENAIKLDKHSDAYVGRVNYYNIIVPAEVTSQGARAKYLTKLIEKSEFEILVAATTEECNWESYPETLENIVRAGTAWNGEPTYIGRCDYVGDDDYKMVSIYLSSKKWDPSSCLSARLICNVNNKWIGASSENTPNNTINNGNSPIARLVGPVTFVPGQVDNYTAIAAYEGRKLTSSSYQVLVGDPYEYSWTDLTNNVVPDHAVVAGESENGELIYIVKSNWLRVQNFVFSKFNSTYRGYEILVKNVTYT